MNYLKILSTGSYTPENIVTNDDLSKVVDTNDEWITTRTGISERRIAVDEDASDLAYKAAMKALDNSGVKVEDIDLIIVSATAPDYYVPSVACKVQGMLQANNAVAFDITAACTGMIYGLKIAQQFAQDNKYKNILVLCSEVLSKIVDWKDRNTCVLFGDGASAVLLQSTQEKQGIISSDIFSNGAMGDSLTCKTRNLNNLLSDKGNDYYYIEMDGKEIFKFGTKVIYESIKTLLDENNLTMDDVKYVVPHQANIRMIDFAAKKLKWSKDKFYVNLNKYGNTSSASIGIALDEMVDQNLLEKGDKIILVGFGGGLTWGYTLLQW